MSTRAVRFSKAEEELISEFLEKNPFFDFSSLTRLAVMQFIENPKLEVTPVKSSKNSKIKTDQQERIQ